MVVEAAPSTGSTFTVQLARARTPTVAASSWMVVLIIVRVGYGLSEIGSVDFVDDRGVSIRVPGAASRVRSTHDAKPEDDGSDDSDPKGRDADKRCCEACSSEKYKGADDVEYRFAWCWLVVAEAF